VPRNRLLLPLILSTAVLVGCSGSNAVDPTTGNPKDYIDLGQGETVLAAADRPAVPDLTGTLIDGQPFSSSAWSGSVIVVNFWGSWCAPCIAEADAVEAVADQTAPLGVHVLGIDVRDTAVEASAFDRRHGITYPSIEDPSEQTALSFPDLPPDTIPSTVVIDRRGREAVRILGAVEFTGLLAVVRQVAAEPS